MRLILTSVACLILAVGLGVMGGKVGFFHNYFVIIPWVLVALILGHFVKSKTAASINGFFYGYIVMFSFIASEYSGPQQVIHAIFPYIMIFALGGAVCGAILELLGSFMRFR